MRRVWREVPVRQSSVLIGWCSADDPLNEKRGEERGRTRSFIIRALKGCACELVIDVRWHVDWSWSRCLLFTNTAAVLGCDMFCCGWGGRCFFRSIEAIVFFFCSPLVM